MRFAPIPVAAALVVVLGACGSPQAAQDEAPVDDPAVATEGQALEPTQEIFGPGEFELTTADGAQITMQIPADPPADIEAFREEVGAEPVTYMTAQLDNRKGSTAVGMYQVTLYDPEGNTYVFEDASVSHIGEWGPTYTEDYEYLLNDGTKLDESTGEALSSQSTDLYNKYLNSGNVDALAKGEAVMMGAFEEVPEEITGVAVQAYGMGEPEYAVPSD
ncbi:lipoprotein [Arthrobacter crystallopoietes BAB-32]|uniref:Lipoprotein n=1 Tax=Arthrobacter crystallopoietes BAB-32 TaxID=1246476 RepID=N1UZ09_9MICC|nr:hypothetical protein [Arthrobacter crystallopoietes]EMY35636.1 lipoprotein [Arthrobacter crystallopoietes BAB-32]